MRQTITINSKNVMAVKQGKTFVIWKGGEHLTPDECLKQKFNYQGLNYIVYEACDPFAYPYAEDSVNEGKVVEVECIVEGQQMPPSRVTNEEQPVKKERLKR